MQRLIWVLLAIAINEAADGRLLERTWSYQEMFDKADLVVIARPTSTKTSGERTTLTDVKPALPVLGMLTEFQTRLVLKGDRKLSAFVLHHYRLDHNEVMVNGPHLVDFDPHQDVVFLLFLIREANGTYAPVTGQTDPGLFSVIEIKDLL